MKSWFNSQGNKTIYISLPSNICFRINLGGKPYYIRDIGDFKDIKVNLKHKGLYTFSHDIYIKEVCPLEIINPLKLSDLPEYERNNDFPTDWKKHIDTGHTPARMSPKHGIIETGERFHALPYEWRIFILLHEMSHSKYMSELKCDLMAFYWFMELGYNQSQALYAVSKVLHDKKPTNPRIEQIYNLIKPKN